MTDSYRKLYPDKEAYTFWSYMGGARAKNVGWRLDYFLLQVFRIFLFRNLIFPFRAKVKNGSMIMLSILMWWALTTVQSSWNLTFPFKLTYYRTLHFTAFIILINSFQITENESFELDFGSYGQGSFSRCLLSSTRWFAIKFTPKGKTVN